MAEGGYDLEMDEINDSFKNLRIEQDRNNTAVVSYTNPAFEGNESYNTADNSNLAADETFTPGRPPNLELENRGLEIASYEDWLEEALKKDKRTWPGATKTGKRLLAGRIYQDKQMVYYRANDGRDRQISETDNPIKISSYKTINEAFGKVIADEIKDLLYAPDPGVPATVVPPVPNLRLQTMGPNIVEANIADTNIIDTNIADTNIIERQMQETAETSFIENVINNESAQTDRQVIDSIIDASEEELTQFGMTKENVREMKAMWRSIDLEAKMKMQVNDRIETLKENISKINREINDLEPEDSDDAVEQRQELIKDRDRFQEELEHEQLKQMTLQSETEPRLQRLKRLITDVIKRPDSKIPLKDRLKLLFKLEGLTISAIIAAVVMLFSTVGLAISNSLSGGGGGSPTPAPTPSPGPEPSIPDKVKEGLKKLAEWLKELAKKSAAALPGVIGSIVAFILKSVGAAVGFMAEHVIIFLVVIVSSIVYGLIEGVKKLRK